MRLSGILSSRKKKNKDNAFNLPLIPESTQESDTLNMMIQSIKSKKDGVAVCDDAGVNLEPSPKLKETFEW